MKHVFEPSQIYKRSISPLMHLVRTSFLQKESTAIPHFPQIRVIKKCEKRDPGDRAVVRYLIQYETYTDEKTLLGFSMKKRHTDFLFVRPEEYERIVEGEIVTKAPSQWSRMDSHGRFLPCYDLIKEPLTQKEYDEQFEAIRSSVEGKHFAGAYIQVAS